MLYACQRMKTCQGVQLINYFLILFSNGYQFKICVVA